MSVSGDGPFVECWGIPTITDNEQGAVPRGFAVRFHLGKHVHTDIIGHSADAFPARTAEGAHRVP
jgi:catalase